MASMLDIKEGITFDEKLQEYQIHEHEPQSGAQLNNSGAEIRITIETQHLFLHPAERYLLVEGRLMKNDDTAYADADFVSLVHNDIIFLFKSISHRLPGKQIEHLNDPGVDTTMLGMLTYPGDFSKSQGLSQLWYKDTTADAENENTGFKARRDFIIAKPTTKGNFSFTIPLKHIFGFADDYDKGVYGFEHELRLLRDSNFNAVLRACAVNDVAKIKLSKLSWFVPHVNPSDESKMLLYKTIQSKSKIQCGFRIRQCDSIPVPQSTQFTCRLAAKAGREKPRWIIVGFQTNRTNNKEHNAAVFDHCRLKNIQVTLNAERYPVVDFNAGFTQNKTARLYKEAADFRKKFHHMQPLLSNGYINPSDFINLYPLFVIDVSHQSERLKEFTVDIQTRAEFERNVAANTEAFALVISDRIIQFESDGQKMAGIFLHRLWKQKPDLDPLQPTPPTAGEQILRDGPGEPGDVLLHPQHPCRQQNPPLIEGTRGFTITLSTGSYGIDEINDEIQRQLRLNKHKAKIIIDANRATLKATLIWAKNYQDDFNVDNSSSSVLGFQCLHYTFNRDTNGYTEGENIVNIISINSILVHSDIISGSYVNGSQQ